MFSSPRTVAALAGAGLLASVLPLLATTGAGAAGTTKVVTNKTPIDYACDFAVTDPEKPDATPFLLNNLETTVQATFSVPSKLYPGKVIAPTGVAINVGMFPSLGGAAREVFGARTYSGFSDDASVQITSAEGATTSYPLGTLSAPLAEIPLDEGPDAVPWVVPASGTSPAITVPSTSRLLVQAPETFTLTAKIFRPDGTFLDVDAPCEAVGRTRTISYLKVSRLYPKLTAKAVPTDAVAGRTKPVVTVKGFSEATPTGTVNVLEGDKVLGTATLKNGAAAVQLPVFGKMGTRTLTVAYAGDVANNAASTSTSITVR